ncbi:MAG: amino acid ABC transporter permease [Anaerolineae bacterium]
MGHEILQALPYMLQGVFYTLGITAIALGVGLVIGMVLALMRVYGGKAAQIFSATYVVVLRGFPSLVVLFIIYFMLARFINLPPFLAGCVALGVCSSAYQAEIFRGAIQGVAPGQMMAARALGMTRTQAIIHIIMPQALRNAIPAWSNEAAVVVKDSSLVYAVGLAELLRRSQQVAARLRAPLLVFTVTALIYFLLTFSVNRLLDWVEKVTRIPEITEAR